MPTPTDHLTNFSANFNYKEYVYTVNVQSYESTQVLTKGMVVIVEMEIFVYEMR